MKFGTSGLRGPTVDLVEIGAKTYATAFGRYLLETGKAQAGDPVLIGGDLRESSPEIKNICGSVLERLCFRILDCGTVPTPALAFYGSKLKVASLMVTGSHIPADRNGIKFYGADGEIDKADEAAIADLAAIISATDDAPVGRRVSAEDHSDRCLNLFRQRNAKLLGDGALAGLKIGIYQHSSVARDLIAALLSKYGAHVLPLARSEVFIPVDTEAISHKTIMLLKTWAFSHRVDAIVSADGDGDRPLITDETGTPLRGDLIGVMTAQFLGAKTIVTPVTSNSGIEALGLFTVTRTKVGSPFVIVGMEEALAASKDRVLGFEANGGVLTGDAFDVGGYRLEALPTRDCILPILAVLSLVKAQKRPLSVIAQSYQLPVAVADRLENFPVETSAGLLSYLRASGANLSAFLREIGQVTSTNDIDGIRVTLAEGRTIHFRPSGNAPELRCYAEAATETAALELLNAGLTRLRLWATGM
ncbi:phosphomannomutase [Sinorhizobium numidicum]|uniref:Phosphomannomutase n=1 Tax=Sinorhizobium numidicum TaxID=680248 RepID=A0ABY8CSW6_9HYPH|nr:phosphomannomutase [Sinorhizobium numidicum]WEX75750.1 phosphomannomutase [Sinorhizobium numidicum]WEX81738.1 phosphomannomutase [Sinorhizobium numidicum]